jgi:hypothetical protein
MNTEANIDNLCQSMETQTVSAAAVPAKKRIIKTNTPTAPHPSETVSVQIASTSSPQTSVSPPSFVQEVAETPLKKKRTPKVKTPKNILPLTTVSDSLQAPIPFRWHTYTLDYEHILQSFFVADGRYVGLSDVGGKVEPVFFVACSSNWTAGGELPVIFVESTTYADGAGVDHFEPCWETESGNGMLTIAAMYNCMPYDAKRDYIRAQV